MNKVDYINKIIEHKPEYKKNMYSLWTSSKRFLQKLYNDISKEVKKCEK